MLNRFVKLNHVIALLILAVCSLTQNLAFCAESYPVPQLAEAKVIWDHNDPLPEGYRIYCRTEGKSYNYSQPCWTGTENSGQVYNLDWETKHYFVVKAFDGDLESDDSVEVSYATPPAVSTAPPISADAPLDVPIYYSITTIPGAHGTITPGGVVEVAENESRTLSIKPESGYHVEDVIVDGKSHGTINSYFFDSVVNDHTIHASFAADETTSDVSEDVSEEFSTTVKIWIEAEDGDLHWPFAIAGDNYAYAGGYVLPAEEAGNRYEPADDSGFAEYFFKVPETGDYHIWGRQMSTNTSSDSFFVSVDDQNEMAWHTKICDDGNWAWDVVSLRHVDDVRDSSSPMVFRLEKGNHKLVVKHREGGTKLDRILITNQPNSVIYEILQSFSSDRTGALPLDDTEVKELIYPFVEPVTDIKSVVYYVDGVLAQTENVAPFDLAGGSETKANPFDTSALSIGTHTIQAEITKVDGSCETITAEINVNGSQYSSWLSPSPDRSQPKELDGATVDGSIYVFVEPVTDIKSVVYYVDGVLAQTENVAPFDLAGGSETKANPYDTSALSIGTHTIQAEITKVDGSCETITAEINVNGSQYSSWLSPSPDRSQPKELDGATVDGSIYVFVEPVTDIKSVVYYVDGVLAQTENVAPFDLAGGSKTKANPFDTSALSIGTHTIQAEITKVDGSCETITAEINVNGSQYSSWLSPSPDRSQPKELDGATVDGSIYVFVEPVTDIKSVVYYVDGVLAQTENVAPFDLAGGSKTKANPFDTSALSNGLHTISATVTNNEGISETLTAYVSVENYRN
jgi:hypothetical protein